MSRVDTGVPLRACSACAGDYEDPERTVWAEEIPERADPDETDQLDEAAQRDQQRGRDDFPVQR